MLQAIRSQKQKQGAEKQSFADLSVISLFHLCLFVLG